MHTLITVHSTLIDVHVLLKGLNLNNSFDNSTSFDVVGLHRVCHQGLNFTESKKNSINNHDHWNILHIPGKPFGPGRPGSPLGPWIAPGPGLPRSPFIPGTPGKPGNPPEPFCPDRPSPPGGPKINTMQLLVL